MPVMDAVHILKPNYVFIENVPNFLNTAIEVKGNNILIPKYIENELGNEYEIHSYTINTKNYSVPMDDNDKEIIRLISDKKSIVLLNN